jgi:hypothetical protein
VSTLLPLYHLYCDFTSTFYIYILAGSTFRKDLKRLLSHNRFMDMMFEIRQNP